MAFTMVIYVVDCRVLKKCEMTPLIIDFGQTEVYNTFHHIEF